jgi:hypothetical protein
MLVRSFGSAGRYTQLRERISIKGVDLKRFIAFEKVVGLSHAAEKAID